MVNRSAAALAKNRQSGLVDGARAISYEAAEELLAEESILLAAIEALYQRKLLAGFPKELARTHLSVSRYSRMRAGANLRNWIAFLTLRSDKNPGAQWEIRQYANVVAEYVQLVFPRTYELFQMGAR